MIVLDGKMQNMQPTLPQLIFLVGATIALQKDLCRVNNSATPLPTEQLEKQIHLPRKIGHARRSRIRHVTISPSVREKTLIKTVRTDMNVFYIFSLCYV
jgi:hypothetical protein